MNVCGSHKHQATDESPLGAHETTAHVACGNRSRRNGLRPVPRRDRYSRCGVRCRVTGGDRRGRVSGRGRSPHLVGRSALSAREDNRGEEEKAKGAAEEGEGPGRCEPFHRIEETVSPKECQTCALPICQMVHGGLRTRREAKRAPRPGRPSGHPVRAQPSGCRFRRPKTRRYPPVKKRDGSPLR